MAQQPRLAQGQVFGIGAGQMDHVAPDGIGHRTVDPARHRIPIVFAHRIERAARGQRRIEPAPPHGTIGPARAQRAARRIQRIGQRAQFLRQQRVDPQPQRLGQPGTGACGADRNHHRRPIDQRWCREIAQVGTVDHIDQQPGTTRAQGIGLQRGFIVMRDKRDPCALVDAERQIIDHAATRALDQPRLGRRRLAVPQHHHRLPGQTVKQRQRGQRHTRKSGTRSAARMAEGAMRSATTAQRSPSTITSGTIAREL